MPNPLDAALISALALLLDRLLGEPRHHPLSWFGRFADYLETRLNCATDSDRPATPRHNLSTTLHGALATLLCVSPALLLTAWLQYHWRDTPLHYLLDLAIVTFVVGWQSLQEHATAVRTPLQQGDLNQARQHLAHIVSRDTHALAPTQISASTIESILENGHDSVFASLFWYTILGPSGALLHRLINTLDAMWGYPNARFIHFGKTAARLDDLLGWPSARLTALAYALSGHTRRALRCWRTQSQHHKSPNGGRVMASGAGALNRRIGGPTPYAGVLQPKPWLGHGPPPQPTDITRALKLVERALILWLGLLILFGVGLAGLKQ